MIINDLVDGVVDKLRGRRDTVDKIPGWLRKAILDLTESYPFEELALPPVNSNFVTGQSEYPLNFFMESLDANLVITRVYSWFRFFTTTGSHGQVTGSVNATPFSPNTSSGAVTGSAMKYRERQTVEPGSVISGLPYMWTQHGKTLIVAFNPDQNYACYVRCQREHPFVEGNIGASQLFMPRDWQEIVEYAAAEKACDFYGMNEVGQMYHQKLFGYKDKRGNETPGLISVRESQQERNSGQNERQLQPQVRRYT